MPNINNPTMNKWLKEVAKKAGIKQNLYHHMARHTCATTILLVKLHTLGVVSLNPPCRRGRLIPLFSAESRLLPFLLVPGVTLEMVKEFLGYKNFSSTMIYARVTNTSKIMSMERLVRILIVWLYTFDLLWIGFYHEYI